MDDRINELHALYEEVRTCEKCRKGCKKIETLPKEAFRYCWHPYGFGEPPFAFMFFAYEPSFSGEMPSVIYPEYTPFNEPLQFAIRKFLLTPGRQTFYITNMAKCSIAGELAESTRDYRFTTCRWVLLRELRMAQRDTAPPEFVSIGLDPRNFIERFIRSDPNAYEGIFRGRTIHRITHYSIQNVNLRFKRYAKDQAAEYEQFCVEVQEEYADFLKQNFEWHLIKGSIPDGDLQTLFFWSHNEKEMPTIRKSLSRNGDQRCGL